MDLEECSNLLQLVTSSLELENPLEPITVPCEPQQTDVIEVEAESGAVPASETLTSDVKFDREIINVDIERRCLFCYSFPPPAAPITNLESDAEGHAPGEGEADAADVKLSSYESKLSTPSDDFKEDPLFRGMNILSIYKALKLSAKAGIKAKDKQLNANAPLCPVCLEIVEKAKGIAEQIEQLEETWSFLREEMLDKLKCSFDESELSCSSYEDERTGIWSFMRIVDRMRLEIMTDIGFAKKIKDRKNYKRAKKKIKEEGEEPAEDVSAEQEVLPILEEVVQRTSRGRVIKRPEIFNSYSQNLDGAILEDDEEQDDSCDQSSLLVPKVEVNGSENEDEEYEPDPEWSPSHDMGEYQIAESDYSSSGSDDEMDFDIGDGEGEDLTKELTGEDEGYDLAAGEEGPPKSKKARQNRSPKTPRKTKKKSSKGRAKDDEDDDLEITENELKGKKGFSKIPVKVIAEGVTYDGFFMKQEAEKDKSVVAIDALAIEDNMEVFIEADLNQDQDQEDPSAVAESVNVVAIPQAGEVFYIEETSPGIRIRCTEPGCRRTFSTLTKVKVHIKRKHLGIEKPYSCNLCDSCFQLPGLLRKHMLDHGVDSDGKPTIKKRHTCCMSTEFGCGQMFRNASELRIHVRTHTGETPYKCEHCDKSFVSSLKREFHIEQSHWEIPPLKCDFCPKAFFRQHRLRIHRISHTGEKAYLCEICSQSFSHPTYLKYHQGQHAELNLETFKCKDCGKTFANPTNLRLHVKTVHLKQFRFNCEVCGMGFTHMSHKRIHMRGHTGERPYKCELCGESFRYRDRLRIHMRGHTGERPFICEMCKKGFASRSKLKRHEKIHEKNQQTRTQSTEEMEQQMRHRCDDCLKGFAEPQHLSAHRRYCQRKAAGVKEEKSKSTKSSHGSKIRAVASVAPKEDPIQEEDEDVPEAQTTQMLVSVPISVNYAYPVTYGYEVTTQTYQPQTDVVEEYQTYN